MNQAKIMVELHKLSKLWFEVNKHLTNKEMLAAGLIDGCDLVWVNRFREGQKNVIVGDVFDSIVKTGIIGSI